MDHITIIGIIASVFTGTSLLPQLFKLVKDKETAGLSYGMLAVLFIGLGFWVYYGILRDDWIIIISNTFSLLVNMTIAILSWVYTHQQKSTQT
jgi:MtN3 and saliva related transmembrane protein